MAEPNKLPLLKRSLGELIETLGEKGDDPVAMYLNDIFTVTANLTGLPALALPAALDANGLPLGLQVIGKALDEESVFAVSAALEQAAAFRAKPAKWWS